MAPSRARRFLPQLMGEKKACFQLGPVQSTQPFPHTHARRQGSQAREEEEVAGIPEEAQDYSQEKKKRWGELLGGAELRLYI